MTLDEALALPAGRELDALVHTRVMGLELESVAIVSNDGGASACAWVDRRNGPWYSLTELALWLGEQKSRGLHLDYMIGEWQRSPKYSQDIAAAWMVVEKLRIFRVPSSEGHFAIMQHYEGGYRAGWLYYEDWEPCVIADTAPLAICRAALKACWDKTETPLSADSEATE